MQDGALAAAIVTRAMPLPSGRRQSPCAAASASTARMVIPRKLGTAARRRSARQLARRLACIFARRIVEDVAGSLVGESQDRRRPRSSSPGRRGLRLGDQRSAGGLFRQILRHIEHAQRFRGHDAWKTGAAAGRRIPLRRGCRSACHHHHDGRIGHRREAHERAVVGVRIVMRRGIENLRGAGLAAARIAVPASRTGVPVP